MKSLLESFQKIINIIEKNNIEYMVVGSIAS